MTAPWPLAQWGLDIMGPLPVGRRQLKFLVVDIDYFTKWVKAEPLATITEKNVKGVRMEDNHMQVWNPQDFHIQQWTTI